MAQGDFTISNKWKGVVGDGNNWGGLTVKVMLVSGSPNQDTTEFIDDISSSEITAANYTAGGVEITDSDPTVDNTANTGNYDAGDASWTSLGVPSATITYAVVYVDTGTASTSPVIGWVELSTQPNGGNYSIAWASTGVFKIG